MSFWTSIRDAFTAPARAAWETVSGIAEGKNVFETVQRGALKQYFAGEAQLHLAFQIPQVRKVTDSLSPYTGGLLGEIGEKSDISQKYVGESDYETSGAVKDWLQTSRTSAKVGAVVGAAVLGGSALSGSFGATGGSVIGATAATKLVQGDYAGAVGTVASPLAGSLVPQEYQDAFGDAKDYYNEFFKTPEQVSRAPEISGDPYSFNSGYGVSRNPQSSQTLAPALLVIGASALGFYLYKRAKR